MTKAIGSLLGFVEKRIALQGNLLTEGGYSVAALPSKNRHSRLSDAISSGKERQPVPQKEDKCLLSLYDAVTANAYRRAGKQPM